jgi:hypothetical protein
LPAKEAIDDHTFPTIEVAFAYHASDFLTYEISEVSSGLKPT